MILADGSIYTYPGHFYVANREVNVQTGTIHIQGLFPNPDNILRPGLYAKIRSATDVQRGACWFPKTRCSRPRVNTRSRSWMPLTGSACARSRPASNGNLRIIEEGMKPGERVITEGLQRVTDGMEVRPRLAPPSQTTRPLRHRRNRPCPRGIRGPARGCPGRRSEKNERCRSSSSTGQSWRWSWRFFS